MAKDRSKNAKTSVGIFSIVAICSLWSYPRSYADSIINFDELSSLEDVDGAYSSFGVHFVPNDFTVLKQGVSLNPVVTFVPSSPNVVRVEPTDGAIISFDALQSIVSLKYGTIAGGVTITVSGPNYTQSFPDTTNSFPNISKTFTFKSTPALINTISFSNQPAHGTIIDNLLFSTPVFPSGPIFTNNSGSPCINPGSGSCTSGTPVTGPANISVGNLVIGTGGTGSPIGTLTVGPATLTATSITVGGSSSGDATVQPGGAINTGSLSVGDIHPGSLSITHGTVAVTGTTDVGNFARGDLAVSGGGSITSASINIGGASTGEGTVSITGAGSSLTNTGSDLVVGLITTGLVVGNAGIGSLSVTSGGRLTTTGLVVGNETGSTGTVVVDGTSSTFTSTGNITLGNNGSALLSVQNGGSVTIGSGSTILVGSGSGSTGTLTVASGAAVSTPAMDIGVLTGAQGLATINGKGSTLKVAQSLIVGDSGTGSLSVTNGGTVDASTAGSTTVALSPGSKGSISVDGIGSTLLTGNILALGQNSGTSPLLNITNGGTVWVGAVGTPLASGGGFAISNGQAIFDIRSGHSTGIAGTPDISTTGALQLGGTIQIITDGTSFTGDTFIPLVDSSSVNLLGANNQVSIGSRSVDPITGDYVYPITNLQGGANANILIPQSANLAPTLAQQSIGGNTVDVFGLINACTADVINGRQPPSLSNKGMFSGYTAIEDHFTPNVGLKQAAIDCGVASFGWVNIISAPDPSGIYECTDVTCANPVQLVNVINLHDPSSIYGYDYCNPNSSEYADRMKSGEQVFDCTNFFPYYPRRQEDDKSLIFSDSPQYPCLGPFAIFLTRCNNTQEFGRVLFTTTLVGIFSDDTQANPHYVELSDSFTWEDTFNGITGGITIPANEFLVDPDSGTGGITILSVNGVPVDASQVPEPSTFLLLLSGLCFVWLYNRQDPVCGVRNGKLRF